MLLEFTVGNYLSFKEKKTLSLEATAIKEREGNVFTAGNYKLLRSAVIYGANSSGKSNLINALMTMQSMVIISANKSSTYELETIPFLLSTETENQPSFFEVLFLIDDIRYRYGFELDRKYVHAEWLFERIGSSKEKALFVRDKDNIEVTKDFSEGKGLEERTRLNALFLSVVDQFNGKLAQKIVIWFMEQLILSGLQHEEVKILTDMYLKGKLNTNIKDFLIPLDLGFKDVEIIGDIRLKNDNFNYIATYHNKYDKFGNIVDKREFRLFEQESSGTNKLYDMAGYITQSLITGSRLIIDELDAKLHPLLTMAIIKLFNSPEHNPKNAQLIFATHDTNLLSYGGFRRDQIYFTEKDRFEATDLYSLVEYKETDGTKVRNDRSYEKDYIAGRYGAIPFIGNFSNLLDNGKSSKD
jgi:uncharacterized protein